MPRSPQFHEISHRSHRHSGLLTGWGLGSRLVLETFRNMKLDCVAVALRDIIVADSLMTWHYHYSSADWLMARTCHPAPGREPPSVTSASSDWILWNWMLKKFIQSEQRPSGRNREYLDCLYSALCSLYSALYPAAFADRHPNCLSSDSVSIWWHLLAQNFQRHHPGRCKLNRN